MSGRNISPGVPKSMEVGLRKFEENGVEFEAKFKVQWSWSVGRVRILATLFSTDLNNANNQD
jgi:hypothetical protein